MGAGNCGGGGTSHGEIMSSSQDAGVMAGLGEGNVSSEMKL